MRVMCGRYALRTSIPEIAAILGIETELAESPPVAMPGGDSPRFNIAPTQSVLGCRTRDGAMVLDAMRWGLIPSWAKDKKLSYRLINARAETVAEKPAFRAAYRRRRCLVAADGYYEWRTEGTTKQPYFFHLHNHAPFFFAGVWEIGRGDGGEPIVSCAIITTQANSLGRGVHPRMPVILDADHYARWLDDKVVEPARLTPLLQPYPERGMACAAVSTVVNSPRNDDERCIAPA